MVMKQFESKINVFLKSDEENFISKFPSQNDRNILVIVFKAGGSLEEMHELGVSKQIPISSKVRAALCARYERNWPYEIAKRLVQEPFNDEQLGVIMSTILYPDYGVPANRILNEILYAKYSSREMLEWVNEYLIP